jgi:hypothetical protein
MRRSKLMLALGITSKQSGSSGTSLDPDANPKRQIKKSVRSAVSGQGCLQRAALSGS